MAHPNAILTSVRCAQLGHLSDTPTPRAGPLQTSNRGFSNSFPVPSEQQFVKPGDSWAPGAVGRLIELDASTGAYDTAAQAGAESARRTSRTTAGSQRASSACARFQGIDHAMHHHARGQLQLRPGILWVSSAEVSHVSPFIRLSMEISFETFKNANVPLLKAKWSTAAEFVVASMNEGRISFYGTDLSPTQCVTACLHPTFARLVPSAAAIVPVSAPITCVRRHEGGTKHRKVYTVPLHSTSGISFTVCGDSSKALRRGCEFSAEMTIVPPSSVAGTRLSPGVGSMATTIAARSGVPQCWLWRPV